MSIQDSDVLSLLSVFLVCLAVAVLYAASLRLLPPWQLLRAVDGRLCRELAKNRRKGSDTAPVLLTTRSDEARAARPAAAEPAVVGHSPKRRDVALRAERKAGRMVPLPPMTAPAPVPSVRHALQPKPSVHRRTASAEEQALCGSSAGRARARAAGRSRRRSPRSASTSGARRLPPCSGSGARGAAQAGGRRSTCAAMRRMRQQQSQTAMQRQQQQQSETDGLLL